MKTDKKHIAQAVAFLFLLIVLVYGCKKDDTIGVEILPAGDLINVKSEVIKEDISAYTFNEDLIRTDEATHSLLGSFTDSLFGNTTIDFATQFRLLEFPDYGNNATPDSVLLFMYYRMIYGDTVTPQRFKVYELEQSLDVDEQYKQDVDLKSMASGTLLGETEYIPKIRLDSATADTFYQLISIPIDISIGEKLMNADSLQMINNDVFLEYFKGLYVETDKQNEQGGAILSLEASSTSTFQGSALVVYYSNDSTRTFSNDTSFVMPYIISQFSARVNHIDHDYSTAPFYENLNSEAVVDSQIYIQATGGLKSRILIDDLSSWADSANTAINRAELIFEIDTTASQVSKFPPPTQLLFTVVDSANIERLPIDYVFSPTYYGGTLQDDYTYHFNITQHLQQIINGDAANRGFYLTPAQKNNEANRVIIKGSTSKSGIKLIITYSKFTN